MSLANEPCGTSGSDHSPLTRRQFLGAVGATAGLVAGATSVSAQERAQPPSPKAPFKLLFNNDSTNILSCESPYHKRGEPFRPEMLEATVDEVKDVDAHLLMPGMGWAPWWPSQVLPMEKHHEWFRKTYGVEPKNSFHDYLLGGGDMVKVFVDRCRLRGVSPFISFRLNDSHHFEQDLKPKPWGCACLNEFWKAHPDYRIVPGEVRDWHTRVLNWAIPEVREHKFAFIRELCENYDLDGFELDFMRHCSFFNTKQTPPEKRADIIAAFVARVRSLLDRTAKPGQRRWLSARIPCFLDTCEEIGTDPKAMVAAGLDMLNVSPYYFTRQDHELDKIRRLAPDATVYLEMTHATTPGPSRHKGYDSFSFLRTTRQQLCTTAHLAYEEGADGISLFNFVYYREHGTPGRGPFNEPPFDVFPLLKNPARLAARDRWYFLGADRNPRRKVVQAPRRINGGETCSFKVRCAPADGLGDGILRIMCSKGIKGPRWRVSVNGAQLKPTRCVLKPLDHPYDGGLGSTDQYECFACPSADIRRGVNTIEATLAEGEPLTVTYLDLAQPRRAAGNGDR